MNRLARVLPFGVGLFVVAVVAFMLVAKSRTTLQEPASPPSGSSGADLRMKEVEIEEQSGSVRWRLTAEQALVFEREGRTFLRKISVLVHDEDRTFTIVADEGDVRERAPRVRDVEVRNNVVVTSSDGYRLATTVLRWDGAGRRLWTDVPVTLTRDGTVIQGKTFELLTGDERSTMRGVRVTFVQGAGR
jgi:LPS export ABC transporter protein LptC